jgi:hypothetical protein
MVAEFDSPLASVTVNVGLLTPGMVGTPLTVPSADIVSPGGSVPLLIDQW